MKKVKHYNGITKEYILEVLELRDGKFYWVLPSSNFVEVGQEAGCLDKHGYRVIRMGNKSLFTARLAFLCYHNWLPKNYRKYYIDHEDLNKTNNTKKNLRCITASQSNMNRTSKKNKSSKYLGVAWKKTSGKYVSRISIAKKEIHLGLFEDEIEAAKAYDKASLKYHGEYANPNFKE